jgi:Flp pilus assembly pilin Flp
MTTVLSLDRLPLRHDWGDVLRKGGEPIVTRAYVWTLSLADDLWQLPRTRRGDSTGQGLAEYALILALIAIIAILALIFLGSQIRGILSNVGKSV